MYQLVIDYAIKYNIHYIKLYNNQNVNDLLRDAVHTNINGAKLYSKEIFNYFIKNMHNKKTFYCEIPNENEFSNFKILKINKIIKDKIVFIGNFKIFGIAQNIGNFSGIVEIIINNSEKTMFNIWDQWCYFNREVIRLQTEWANTIEIVITQNSFDTSLCKENIDFTKFEKYMDINEIYYIGELSMC